jgi:predicted dinucleotide-binding enzyme
VRIGILGAEELARKIHKARIVSAFNTVQSEWLEERNA